LNEHLGIPAEVRVDGLVMPLAAIQLCENDGRNNDIDALPIRHQSDTQGAEMACEEVE